jgi:hypothetical protein
VRQDGHAISAVRHTATGEAPGDDAKACQCQGQRRGASLQVVGLHQSKIPGTLTTGFETMVDRVGVYVV